MKHKTGASLVVLSAIEHLLFRPVKEHLKGVLRKILQDFHHSSNGKTGFCFEGELYHAGTLIEKATIAGETQVGTLPSHLHSRMQEYRTQAKKLDNDLKIVRMSLGSMIAGANSYQELRDMFPDSLANVLAMETGNEFLSIDRVNPIPSGTSYLHRQYREQVIPLLEYYLAVRLIY